MVNEVEEEVMREVREELLYPISDQKAGYKPRRGW